MIVFENVTKEFPNGTIAIQDVSFHIEPKEFVFIVGPSGAGKTTILRLLLHQIKPTSGTIRIEETDLTTLKKKQLPPLRRQIGAVFQDYKLIEDHTVRENVALGSEMVKSTAQEIEEDVKEILSMVGLDEKGELFPSQLSGGELQRTAIARALATHPKILFADEPTGNLDSGTAWEIVKLLLQINEAGTTVLFASHNQEIVKRLGKRVIELDHGRVVRDTKKKSAGSEAKKSKPVEEKPEKTQEEKEVKSKKKGNQEQP